MPQQNSTLEPKLSPLRAQVEAWLRDRLGRLAPTANGRVHQAMEYSLLAGGKRLRPILCLAAFQAVRPPGANWVTAVEDAACALEYIHTYSLIHDDLPAMDDDDMRRGRPTNHKVFGEGMAILAGDALLTEAFALLAAKDEPLRLKLVRELSHAAGALGMVGGQAMDIAEDRPSNFDYLARLHRLKTGALIRAACRMGVLCAEAGERELGLATEYGEAVGLAFQIMDDVLDARGDAALLGKPVGADAEAGRYTFVAAMGIEKSEAMARTEIERAISQVSSFPAPQLLCDLARYAVERET